MKGDGRGASDGRGGGLGYVVAGLEVIMCLGPWDKLSLSVMVKTGLCDIWPRNEEDHGDILWNADVQRMIELLINLVKI